VLARLTLSRVGLSLFERNATLAESGRLDPSLHASCYENVEFFQFRNAQSIATRTEVQPNGLGNMTCAARGQTRSNGRQLRNLRMGPAPPSVFASIRSLGKRLFRTLNASCSRLQTRAVLQLSPSLSTASPVALSRTMSACSRFECPHCCSNAGAALLAFIMYGTARPEISVFARGTRSF